ncbi:MAG: hypothetical protein HC901_03235 [Bdellovibrionaceae bacterium]|nr:hypothetical protein [Pseudobdellovibrionaceae bacterium]
MQDLRQKLAEIANEFDICKKQMFTAALVCEAFSRNGFEGIIVGGSAIEFYTDGAYMSGDVDICWDGRTPQPTPRDKVRIMSELGGAGGVRSFILGGLYIDLLNEVETIAKTDFVTLECPYGPLRLIPVEELIVERVLTSVYPQPNLENENCAKKLIAYGLSATGPCDWKEVKRLAQCPEYQILKELDNLVKVVKYEIKQQNMEMG